MCVDENLKDYEFQLPFK